MGMEREVSARLAENVARLEARIQEACQKAHRQRDEILVVPITKYVDASVTRLVMEQGYRILGESRPQIIWEKAAALPEANWHLVGHLQRNKVARTLPLVSLIHSIDSVRLLQAVEEEARRLGKVKEVLLELHMTEEATKSGFSVEEWDKLPDYVAELMHVRVTGLMAMAALESTADAARATFERVRTLRDAWQDRFPSPHHLQQLSMGMTHDFAEAIAAGATIVRIGSAFFEGE